MGWPELLLIFLILLLGLFSMMGDNKQPKINKEPKDDKNLARLRQMKEWDRFDEQDKK